ncbi:MAG: radical SAM protein [Planctomycetes bacterium]|nr:radical SAM protein [Planctomycetota bacterium]
MLNKLRGIAQTKLDAMVGRLFSLTNTLEGMVLRPFELHLEFTNRCNANCVFCPYQFQQRATGFMSDEVFEKAVGDYVNANGGSIGLTPIVGEALLDPKFLDRVQYLRSLPQIDRILLTTNGILLDRFGIEAILTSGLSSINISTSAFDKASYARTYRSPAYERMRRNVTELVEENARLGNRVELSICLRSDRPLDEVLRYPDFQAIRKHRPNIDFAWNYRSVGGRITSDMPPKQMQFRKSPPKREPCVNLFNGAMVLYDGTVIACGCLAAMDASEDLGIGHVLEGSLQEIFTGERMQHLRAQFGKGGPLNQTCDACDAYYPPDSYRTRDGRKRAELNRKRFAGQVVHREERVRGPFSGG